MNENEVKMAMAKLLSKEMPLTEIQNILKNEHDVNMTFLELRILASELENIDWEKLNKDSKEENTSSSDKQSGSVSEDAEIVDNDQAGNSVGNGQTVVELSKIARPGAVASGTVKFGSGASAEWVLDQLGRLGLEKANGQPTQDDIQDFQVELQKLLSGAGV